MGGKTNAAPENVKKIVGVMLDHTLARCAREGIAWEDFYAALLEEQQGGLKGNLEDLFRRVFRRLQTQQN